jgi:hypothetical protein
VPDDQTTDQTPETPVGSTDDAPQGDGTPAPDGDAQVPATSPEDELPDWARKELTKVRGEAASYRTRLRDAEDKLKDAKTPEEFESAVSEIRNANAALERQIMVNKVAGKYELPAELAARLQGDDEAALEADAKALAALVAAKTTPETLGGGLNPGESDDDFDPVAAARKARIRRY